MAGPPGFHYLWFEEEDEAKAQSRSKWTQRLGHPKRPRDVTEYIWVWVWPTDMSYYLVQVGDDQFDMLSPAEQGDLLPPGDALVVACFPSPVDIREGA